MRIRDAMRGGRYPRAGARWAGQNRDTPLPLPQLLHCAIPDRSSLKGKSFGIVYFLQDTAAMTINGQKDRYRKLKFTAKNHDTEKFETNIPREGIARPQEICGPILGI